MKNAQPYKDAIDLLTMGLDLKDVNRILVQVCKDNPRVIVTAARVLGIGGQTLEHRVRELMKADQKINAIKLVRNELNIGLKEAKDWAERFQ
jgi:ribosomal protein L7/L12